MRLSPDPRVTRAGRLRQTSMSHHAHRRTQAVYRTSTVPLILSVVVLALMLGVFSATCEVFISLQLLS